MKNLVIVESPTKSRTLSNFLGPDYRVEASMGHIRDLPKSDIGINIEDNFEPKYIIPRDKIKQVNALKKIASEAKNLWLATDPDREGEAIAWHLAEILKVDDGKTKVGVEARRVVFHEITPEAVKEAFENPRDIDFNLVNAQQARRVLDRLVGYKLSPLLWKKIKSGLSAGRVQSVALRLIVEREREVKAFKPVEYWTIETELNPSSGNTFLAVLIELSGKKLAIKNKQEAENHKKNLEKADYIIKSITVKDVKRYPSPPFTTSTLQQTANLKLGFSSKKTMMLAQGLYERGLITYMRTDSVMLSGSALNQIRGYIKDQFGGKYLPDKPRVFTTKSKLAQEAHEAIRPTNISTDIERIKVSEGLTRDHFRLYELIWKRALASQISEAQITQTSIDIAAGKYTLRANGSVIKFDGWLKVYGVQNTKLEEDNGELNDKEGQILPVLKEGEDLNLQKLLPEQHFTEPPPRFNEASLIKKLEELGIGRPSTYAPTISTIQERYYVEKIEKKFMPTELGEVVVDFLIKHFPDIVDYSFTADMEGALDEIAEGGRQWKKTISDFYTPFEKKLEETEASVERVKIEAEVTDKLCPNCSKPLVVRFGKFGKFLACSSFPECKYTESLEEAVNAKCPKCSGDILVRKTRKGRIFYGCKNWPKCDYASWTKPKLGS